MNAVEYEWYWPMPKPNAGAAANIRALVAMNCPLSHIARPAAPRSSMSFDITTPAAAAVSAAAMQTVASWTRVGRQRPRAIATTVRPTTPAATAALRDPATHAAGSITAQA